MPHHLVSRAEFARIAGVSGPAITKAAKKQLAAALVSDRVDLDHPAAAKYLATNRHASNQIIGRHAVLAHLLLDFRLSLIAKMKVAAKAGATRDELEALIQDAIASQFKPPEEASS